VDLSVSRRLLTEPISRRLQSGSVEVSYEIIVPDTSSVQVTEVRDVLVSASNDVTILAEAITSSVDEVKGEGTYMMVVADVEAPSAIGETTMTAEEVLTESPNSTSAGLRVAFHACVTAASLMVTRLLTSE